jgi:hypothetical protein
MILQKDYEKQYQEIRSEVRGLSIETLEHDLEVFRAAAHLLFQMNKRKFPYSTWIKKRAVKDELASRFDRALLHEQVGYDD